jgi:hypothetical protein
MMAVTQSERHCSSGRSILAGTFYGTEVAMFGYQQPVSYAFDGVGLHPLKLRGLRLASGDGSRVLTNSGRSMYWSNSRAFSVRCWVSSAAEVKIARLEAVETPQALAVEVPPTFLPYASPALSSGSAPMVYRFLAPQMNST